jgi:hypothetical protein
MFLMFLGRKANEHVRHARMRVLHVLQDVRGGVGGGGLRHKKHAQTGASFECFVLWEMRKVPDTKARPNGRVFRVFRVLKRRGGEGVR